MFDHRDRPDYEVFQAVIQYLEEYPEKFHHPKEDLIFSKLKMRDPAVARNIGDVEAEHVAEATGLRNISQAVEFIVTGGEMLRQEFHDAVDGFVKHQRRHMQNEERLLFPAAVKALLPEDWADIETRIKNKQDRLFSDVADQEYEFLQRKLLQWEQEAEATRLSMKHD